LEAATNHFITIVLLRKYRAGGFMKKYIKYFSGILFIMLLLASAKWYFASVSLNKLVSKEIEIGTINNVYVNPSYWYGSNTSYQIKEKPVINNLLDILSKIKVRRILFSPNGFRPSFHITYDITLDNNKKGVSVNILDKDYLMVNHNTYKIVTKPDLKQIYDIVTSVK
jgi:hypothetical protein